MLVTSDKKQASYTWDFSASDLKAGDTYSAQAQRQDGAKDKSNCVTQAAQDSTPKAEPLPEAGKHCPNFALSQPSNAASGQTVQYIFSRPTDGRIQGADKQGNSITLTASDYHFTYKDKTGEFIDSAGFNIWYFEVTAQPGDNKVSWFQNGISEPCGSQNLNIPKPPTTDTPADATGNLSDVKSPVAFGSLGEIVSKALPFVFGFVGLLAVVIFSIGALRYLASRGDAKAADSARGTMTGSVVGLVIVLGAAAVSGVFQNVFGLGLFGTSSRPLGPGNTGGVDLRCAFQLTTGQCIGDKFANFGQLVSFILLLILSVGALAFFFMLIWGGFRFLLARGDEKAVASARDTLTSATIGFLLILAALVIIRLISSSLFGSGVQF